MSRMATIRRAGKGKAGKGTTHRATQGKRKVARNPKTAAGGASADGGLELWQAANIMELIGRSRQRVHQLTREKGFPEPYGYLATGAVWKAADILEWYEANKHRFQPAKKARKKTGA